MHSSPAINTGPVNIVNQQQLLNHISRASGKCSESILIRDKREEACPSTKPVLITISAKLKFFNVTVSFTYQCSLNKYFQHITLFAHPDEERYRQKCFYNYFIQACNGISPKQGLSEHEAKEGTLPCHLAGLILYGEYCIATALLYGYQSSI